ncbi:MAG: uncharacterized protein A8A55_1021 [Amphiamblys sp. WSBS2006]|nr:MAG: uncharacterized protein A8A55_1021 [Amphiamblys sp. WSBS2006]
MFVERRKQKYFLCDFLIKPDRLDMETLREAIGVVMKQLYGECESCFDFDVVCLRGNSFVVRSTAQSCEKVKCALFFLSEHEKQFYAVHIKRISPHPFVPIE